MTSSDHVTWSLSRSARSSLDGQLVKRPRINDNIGDAVRMAGEDELMKSSNIEGIRVRSKTYCFQWWG